MSGALHFADDESDHGGGSTAVLLGLLILVLIGVGVTAHGDTIANRPTSP